MSKTIALPIARSASPFARMFASLDRILLAYAEMMIRNGDVQRCIV